MTWDKLKGNDTEDRKLKNRLTSMNSPFLFSKNVLLVGRGYCCACILFPMIKSWSPYNSTASLLLWKSVEEKVFFN